MYMAVWGVLPHSNSIFYRIFVNYTSDFRHFPKNRRFASGGGWQNGAFVHFAVVVCRFGRRLDLPPLYPAGLALFVACCPLPLACFPAPYPPSPRSQSALPGGTGYPCPGGEDHLKRRRRLRRIVPSPPVPPLLGCRHFPWKGGSFGFAPGWRFRRHTPAGRVVRPLSQCRPGSAPGMQGAKPLA